MLDEAYLGRLNFAARADYLHRLITLFEASSDQQLQGIEQAIAAEDEDAYAQWLYDLYVSSLNLGALRLKQVCVQAEAATDSVTRRQYLADIRQTIRQTRAALLNYERSLGRPAG